MIYMVSASLIVIALKFTTNYALVLEQQVGRRPVLTQLKCVKTGSCEYEEVAQFDNKLPHPSNEKSRRKLFEAFTVSGLSALTTAFPGIASANDPLFSANSQQDLFTSTQILDPDNLNCLLDLKPKTDDCVRIFLCRHGQTENNRLRLVQGARVNVPINSIGEEQALRLGLALSRLKQTSLQNSAEDIELYIPTSYFHSQLQRAQQTAKVALAQVEESILDSKTSNRPKFTISPLPTLGEVDFGPLAEGKKVAEVRPDMARIYGAWSLGRIDERLSPGAESGREVISRIVDTFNLLLEEASKSGSKSVVAVSHGTFLRMALAVALNASLLEAINWDMKNCCVNVLDISMTSTKTLVAGCRLLGGPISQVEKSFHVSMPEVTVVRKNEIRHLEGLI